MRYLQSLSIALLVSLWTPLIAYASAQVSPLATEEAIPGYFVAGSLKKDPVALGGFASSDNVPRPLNRRVPPKQLSLIAVPAEPAAFGAHAGFVVILANDTSQEVGFEASDSRLSIVREAQDGPGQWRAIEYLPSSWCGNSYHRVFLPPGHQWSFVAPEYSGRLRTKMRFVLSYGREQRLYSNEFEGFINPTQFDKRQQRPSGGWMDPYTP